VPEISFVAALGLGLAGAGHCLGMCGGIAAALNLGSGQRHRITLLYHTGRLLSYTLLGGLLGFAAGSVSLTGWTLGLRYLAGAMLIAMGLYIGNWWHGLLLLERAGAILWRPVQSLSRRWLPVRNGLHALALGLCWGLMPCGLIYSSLAWAATAGNALESALLMLVFGIGTLPAMLAVSYGAAGTRRLLERAGFRRGIAVLLILAGLWTLYITSLHGGHGSQAGTPHHHGAQNL